MKKHSVRIFGHPTSITLEDEFWEALRAIAARRGKSLNHVIEMVDENRGPRNLSSALRVFVLENTMEST